MAVAFDAVGPSSAGAGNLGSGTLSYTHTALGSGGALVAGVACGSSADAGESVTATCDGVSMTALTAIIHADNANGGFIRLFGLPNISSGAHTIVFTATGGTPF